MEKQSEKREREGESKGTIAKCLLYSEIKRVLEFHSVIPTVLAQYGGGAGPIYLDEVSCTGSETQLLECRNFGIGRYDCSHFEDVGVDCQPGILILK